MDISITPKSSHAPFCNLSLLSHPGHIAQPSVIYFVSLCIGYVSIKILINGIIQYVLWKKKTRFFHSALSILRDIHIVVCMYQKVSSYMCSSALCWMLIGTLPPLWNSMRWALAARVSQDAQLLLYSGSLLCPACYPAVPCSLETQSNSSGTNRPHLVHSPSVFFYAFSFNQDN